jgi:hypothetical protein
MAQATLTLAPEEATRDFGAAWDRMAEARGPYADIYASHAWFSSWFDGLSRRKQRVVVPAVFEGDRPVAFLPLVRRGWVWLSAGLKTAPRTRVVLADETPRPEVLAALVDEVGKSGVREVSLYRLPTHDPATAMVIDALRAAGWQVNPFERSTDNVVAVAGNEALAKSLRKLATSNRSRERRITPYWPIKVRFFGGPEGEPMANGLELADLVQRRSWKGPSRPATERQRGLFMRRADDAGWAHLAILEIDGRPVAANSFFRIGSVAIGMSTAYEQRLAALSPGFVLHAHVQQEIYGSDPPAVMDMLPGRSPFKDQLSSERPPLVTIEAYRRTLVRGATFGVRRRARWDLPPARARARAEIGARLGRLPRRSRERDVEPEVVVVGPDEGTAGVVEDLPVGNAVSRWLATVSGAPSAEAGAEQWATGDRWLRVKLVDGVGDALVRLGQADDGPAPVREVVPLVVGTSVGRVVSTLAASLRASLGLDPGVERDRVATTGDLPPLSWTDALLDEATGKAG